MHGVWMKRSGQQTIGLLMASLLLLTLAGCGAYVDLDVTIFNQLELESAIPESAYEIPDGAELPEDQELEYPFSQFTDIDLSEQLDDSLTKQIDAIFLDSIDYRVLDNAMTANIANITLHIAPIGTPSSTHKDSIEIGTIPFVAAGNSTETRPFPLSSQGQEALGKFVMEGKFVLFISGQAHVDDLKDRPEGGALIELDIKGSIHRNGL